MSSKATIMYTDVVGYSKLTGDNQQIALIILEEHNKILEEKTKRYSGKIVKLTGDGLCALFDSPIDGVKCSIEIQKALNRRNELNVDERKIQIRIGLHYGSYELKDNDVFGDGVNLTKKIEPVAPHSGIAISQDLNNIIWDTNDIYLRKYVKIEFNGKSIQLYQLYLDLISWCVNENAQNLQEVNKDDAYLKAHKLFHCGDYSSAIKFAFLSLDNTDGKNSMDILSFICHTFICLGGMDYANDIIKKIELVLDKDRNLEQCAHLYKMRGNLEYNLGNQDNALGFFEKSFKLMLKSNERYLNEIVYYILLILLDKDDYVKIKKYLEQCIPNNDSYSKILDGFSLMYLEELDNDKIDNYKNKIKDIDNQHLASFGYRILAKIYLKFKDFDNSKISINESQKLLINSSHNISDINQRDKFLNNILIHKDIMEFSDKISDHFLDLTYEKIKESDSVQEDKVKVHKFCTNCGKKNDDSYNFCISCGNNLKIETNL